MEHALAKEGAAEADAVEAPGQDAILVSLDAVAVPDLVQAAIERADALVDRVRPGRGSAQPSSTPSKSWLIRML
jgi:hypothetical protein